MSEQQAIETDSVITDVQEKVIGLSDPGDENKPKGNACRRNDNLTGATIQSNEEKSVASEAMDVLETKEIKSNDTVQITPEEDLVLESSSPVAPNVLANDEVAPLSMPVDSSEPMASENPAEKVNSEVNVVSQESVPTAKLQVAKQKEQQAVNSIGSLSLLNQYASSSDEDEDSSSSDDDAGADSESESDDSSDSSNNEVLGTPAMNNKDLNAAANSILNSVMSRNNYHEASSDSSDIDSDDSDVKCIGSIPSQTIDITNEDDIQEILDACEENAPPGPIKAKGELGIKDLPPIEELTITVGESECVELGKITGIVDTLVLVESLPGFAAVDIDTVLFLEKGNRTLGQVFDVMGNVSSPIYCVRFNTEQDIHAKNIKAGLQVYVAPQTEYTNFIVLSDLMKQKGCDASWENDHEAPEDYNEFSDDETERLSRRKNNQRQRNRNRPSESNEQLPNKVTIKSEPNANPNSNQKGRRPKFNVQNKPPTRFYKDNRGYSNTHPDSSDLYHQQQQHRMQQLPHQNYSWHTAAPHMMTSASTSAQPMAHPYATNHGSGSNVYPNPFAMQANQLNYSPFNLQAFPTLPPPMSSLPPSSSNSQYNRKNSSSFHQQ